MSRAGRAEPPKLHWTGDDGRLSGITDHRVDEAPGDDLPRAGRAKKKLLPRGHSSARLSPASSAPLTLTNRQTSVCRIKLAFLTYHAPRYDH